jgi:hypothetical protein
LGFLPVNGGLEEVLVDMWWVVLAVVALLVTCIWLVYVRRAIVSETAEAIGEQLIHAVDWAEDEVEDLGGPVGPLVDPPWRVTPGNRHRFIASCVHDAKNRFGIPEDSVANRMVVRKTVFDMMTARGMRPTHISRHINTVVELVFLPSADEILARRLRESVVFEDRRFEYRHGYLPGGLGLVGRLLRAIGLYHSSC